MAWQQHFVTNMFIRPESPEELDGFEPDFTVINCCSQVDEDWERHGLNSETAVVFNVEKKTAVIFGTWYGGENKKGIFSLMNYWLPMADPPQFPMHCSANVGAKGDVALFFGLSGTGKTTLSADPHRALIGDDEHGWVSFWMIAISCILHINAAHNVRLFVLPHSSPVFDIQPLFDVVPKLLGRRGYLQLRKSHLAWK